MSADTKTPGPAGPASFVGEECVVELGAGLVPGRNPLRQGCGAKFPSDRGRWSRVGHAMCSVHDGTGQFGRVEGLEKERRWRTRIEHERERASRPGPGHVGETALLLHRSIGLGGVRDRTGAREPAGVEADHRDVIELEALGPVAWLTVMVICSAFVFTAEHGINKLIDTPFDALWWGVTTLTTVGYGDTYPVTSEGRIGAMVLMLLGIGLFSAITATITSYFISQDERADDWPCVCRQARSLG